MSNVNEAPINWGPAVVLITLPILAVTVLPWYAMTHHFSATAWWSLVLLLLWGGFSITAGYHRLWAHSTYQAKWPVQLFLLIGGTFAMQNSVFYWSSGHRLHHRHVDDVNLDPYSAKRGFWFSHIGWMLRNYPSGHLDYNNIPDLKKNKMLAFQHNHYYLCVFLTNVVAVVALGLWAHDVWGVVLLGGVLRLVLNHHVTFFINSLAHMFGKQPYTDENTARDNVWLALVTFGEGYHNYHHIFQNDYRNGVKWWQFDPTKWLIQLFYRIGLVSHLKRVPEFTIRKAEAAMTFKRAQQSLATNAHSLRADVEILKARLMQEYDAFTQTVAEWTQLQEKTFEQKKELLAQKISEVDAKFKAEFKAQELKMKAHSEAMKDMLLSIKKQVKVQNA